VFLFSSSFLETHLFYFNANNFLRKYCANIEPKTNFFWPFFTWWIKNLLFLPRSKLDFLKCFSNIYCTYARESDARGQEPLEAHVRVYSCCCISAVYVDLASAPRHPSLYETCIGEK
jgi:hypothetical protein